MPIHDWTRVDAGIFHAFHHDWITEISRALNRGILPSDYYALPEQIAGGLGPDVLTLKRPGPNNPPRTESPPQGGVALSVAPPRVSRHRVVAMVELVSPGNKNNQNGLDAFVRKAREALSAGIHLLLVDLFPPGACDPRGIHGAVWGEDCDIDYVVPEDRPLTCVAYVGGAGAEAFVELVAVGEPVPEMPLFLTPEVYVPVPLDATYQAAWEGMPEYWREVVTGQRAPDEP